MSNRYWQVLRTYLERPRFWVLGLTYFLISWIWFWYYDWSNEAARQGQAILSAIYACLICSFWGLHVRRQFSHSAAQHIPGYTTPHLLVAGLLGSVLWLFIPLVAYLADHWSSGAVALHACAVILMCIVACWPRGVLLLMAIPALAIWSSRPLRGRDTPYISELYQGDHPYVAAAFIVAAVAIQGFVAWLLLRLPRKGISTNDEFTLESPVVPSGTNPLTGWLLKLREAEAQRLARTRWLPLVQRWRAPVAIVPLMFFVPVAFVAAAALFGWWFAEPLGWIILAVVLSCAILLLLPLGPWQSRRWAMSQEILRPVSRERYYRQFLGAMAIDMAAWTGIASLLIVWPTLVNWSNIDQVNRLSDFAQVIAIYAAFQWSMAAFVFGVGVACLHWRFWLPTIAVATIGWAFGFFFIMHIVTFSVGAKHLPSDGVITAIYPLVTAAIGLGLTQWTYRRWVRSDVV
jgi:hypothetical protein